MKVNLELKAKMIEQILFRQKRFNCVGGEFVDSATVRHHPNFFCSFSDCADNEPIFLERQVLRARFLGLTFSSIQMRESNPRWLGEKRERYLCAMPSPQSPPKVKLVYTNSEHEWLCNTLSWRPRRLAPN